MQIPPRARVIDLGGATADIIAVAGNQLTDVTEMERVKFVMKGGAVMKNGLAARPAASTAAPLRLQSKRGYMTALAEPSIHGDQGQVVDERRRHEESIRRIVVVKRERFTANRDVVSQVRFMNR